MTFKHVNRGGGHTSGGRAFEGFGMGKGDKLLGFCGDLTARIAQNWKERTLGQLAVSV